MANFPMDDSRYEEDVRKLETSDKAHAGVFNDVFQKLVNNGAFLKRDKVSGEGGDVSGTVVEAMEAASGEFLVPVEGDTSGRLWGKMKKFCEDFNNMKAGLLTVGKIVNDAKTNNPELPVSAAVAYELGKEVERVSGEVSVLNSDLGDCYKLSGGIKIPSGANLHSDEYKIPGNYYCTSNDNAKTLTNCPITKAFTLKIELSTGNANPCQTIREYDSGKNYYCIFSSDSKTWSAWRSTIHNSDLPVLNKNWGIQKVTHISLNSDSNGDFIQFFIDGASDRIGYIRLSK